MGNATTPSGLPHGGMTSPMYNHMPKTPQQQFHQQQHSMMSPSPRSGPSSVPPAQSPMGEDMKSPIATSSMKSPMYTGASNLRKIRRPSKPSNISGGEVSPPGGGQAPPSNEVKYEPPPSNEVKYEPPPSPVPSVEPPKSEPPPPPPPAAAAPV